MKTYGRGVSTVGIIVVIVVLAGVGFAAAYFGSDVFRTKTDSTINEFTKWTPANIAKDPVNYLNFCEAQTKEALKKCKESEIELGQQFHKFEGMRKEAVAKVAALEKALGELKPLYVAAEAGSGFPIKWRDHTPMDKNAARRQIVRSSNELKTNSEKITRLDGALRQVDIQKKKLADAKEDAADQLNKISEARDMLKVQAITDSLKDNLVAMKGAVQTSVDGLTSSDPGTISVDDMITTDGGADDAEFQKILDAK